MDYENLEDEIIEKYTLSDIYEEIEDFSEMTSDLVAKIRSDAVLNNANAYMKNLSNYN